MMQKNGVLGALPAILLVAALAAPSAVNACVGRKLVLGALEDARQGMVSRIISILIHERTGTTVEVKFYAAKEELMEDVLKDKVDLYVDYVEPALKRLNDDAGSLTGSERFRQVKRRYDEEMNLVWLKPLGFEGRTDKGESMGLAAVVVRKGTLKKFPALPRLLEKIGTRVILDDHLLDSLVAKGQSVKPARVAREFLKEKKLI
ncbi:MAG TPA: hypothetical protein ENH32_06735 [Proteobacteria bacterium]|nr:substrate binding domain of ABC-type glycine betaine transport system [bacterium BMS3Abin14]HDL53655.1 hypothetical protein [Pseudomonadota bacterium]